MSYYGGGNGGRYSSSLAPSYSSKDRASPSRYSSYSSPYSSSAYSSPYSSSSAYTPYSSYSSGLTPSHRSGSASSLSSIGSSASGVSGYSGKSADSSRPYSSKRYGSTSDVPTQMSGDRSYSNRLYSRRQPAPESSNDSDYKKMYEECKAENDQLKRKVGSLETELSDFKQQARNSSRSSSEPSISDKRERRALERKLAELEKEVQLMESIKQENVKLKEENGALIRVISKLSK